MQTVTIVEAIEKAAREESFVVRVDNHDHCAGSKGYAVCAPLEAEGANLRLVTYLPSDGNLGDATHGRYNPTMIVVDAATGNRAALGGHDAHASVRDEWVCLARELQITYLDVHGYLSAMRQELWEEAHEALTAYTCEGAAYEDCRRAATYIQKSVEAGAGFEDPSDAIRGLLHSQGTIENIVSAMWEAEKTERECFDTAFSILCDGAFRAFTHLAKKDPVAGDQLTLAKLYDEERVAEKFRSLVTAEDKERVALCLVRRAQTLANAEATKALIAEQGGPEAAELVEAVCRVCRHKGNSIHAVGNGNDRMFPMADDYSWLSTERRFVEFVFQKDLFPLERLTYGRKTLWEGQSAVRSAA